MQFMASISFDTARRSEVEELLPAEQARVRELQLQGVIDALYVPDGSGAAAGLRAIAPDLIGFGRSDKPANRADYTYQRHVDWMHGLVSALGLQRITLVYQDWGGFIGLRVAAEEEDRFARITGTSLS